MNYQTLTSKEAKLAAIAAATTIAELDAMWAAWEERGYTKDSLMFAAVLEKKGDLAGGLSYEDQEIVDRANELRRAGESLPPITGWQPGQE